jgi:hypothetical protein
VGAAKGAADRRRAAFQDGAVGQTAEGARSAFAEIERVVGAASPTVQAFARDGLPQYTRLARETRTRYARLAPDLMWTATLKCTERTMQTDHRASDPTVSDQ